MSVDQTLDEAAQHLADGDREAALTKLQQARDDAVRSLNPNDPRITQALRGCGVLLGELGRHDEAQAQLDAAIARFDDDDPRRAVVFADAANLALSRQDPATAEALLEQAIQTIDENTDDVGVAVVPLLGCLAALKAQTVSKIEEARPLAARALDILITEEGEASVHVAQTLLFCALLDLRSQKPKGARALASRAIEIYEGNEADPDQSAAALYILSESYLALGKTPEAEAAIKKARALETNVDCPSLETELKRMRAAIKSGPAPRPSRR